MFVALRIRMGAVADGCDDSGETGGSINTGGKEDFIEKFSLFFRPGVGALA